MAKTTSKSSSPVRGGSGSMHGFQAVGAQKPGGTAVKMSGGSKSPGAKVGGGGKGKIGGKQVGVVSQKPGITSVR